MTASFTETIRERVQGIETMPAIPAVFLPLLKLLSSSAEEAKVDEVVRLVSYDNTIAAHRNHSSHLLPGTSFPREKVGAGPGRLLETFAGMCDGVPKIQREVGHCRHGKGLHD